MLASSGECLYFNIYVVGKYFYDTTVARAKPRSFRYMRVVPKGLDKRTLAGVVGNIGR